MTMRIHSGWLHSLAFLFLGCAPHEQANVIKAGPDLARTLRDGANLSPRAALTAYESGLDETIDACHSSKELDFSELLAILGRIERLDANALRVREPILQHEILRSPATAVQCARVLTAVCDVLKDADTIIGTLATLRADAASRSVRFMLLGHALGDVYQQRNYAELIRNRDVIFSMAESNARDPATVDEAVEIASTLYEAYLARAEASQAARLSAWMLALSPGKTTYSLLIAIAERLSNRAEVSRLRAEEQLITPSNGSP